MTLFPWSFRFKASGVCLKSWSFERFEMTTTVIHVLFHVTYGNTCGASISKTFYLFENWILASGSVVATLNLKDFRRKKWLLQMKDATSIATRWALCWIFNSGNSSDSDSESENAVILDTE